MLALDDSLHLLEKGTSSPLVLEFILLFSYFQIIVWRYKTYPFSWNVLFGFDNIVSWTLHSESHFPYL